MNEEVDYRKWAKKALEDMLVNPRSDAAKANTVLEFMRKEMELEKMGRKSKRFVREKEGMDKAMEDAVNILKGGK